MNHTRLTRLALFGPLLVVAIVVGASPASADVRVSRAELNGTQLRLDGTAVANRTITVDGVAMGTSDAAGSFRIERDPFTAPADCTVHVNDGSAAPATVTLARCTVSPASSPPALTTIRINPRDVVGGDPSTGTATLTAAAPAGGFVVSLSSDNTAAATVPPSVTIPSGAITASFPITTNVVPNSQSALIIGTAGTVTAYDIVTVWTPFAFNNGSVSILPGGNGSGRVTSSPAGIDCTITRGNGSGGTCSAFFPVGMVVTLDARPAADSKFVGWRSLPGCVDPAKGITISRGTNHTCQVGFQLR